VSLGGSVLPGHPAGEPLTNPQRPLEVVYGSPPGAFDGVDAAPEKVRVKREHNKADAVGKVVSFNPYDPRGLIADIRIAPTPRGDDTLILASEGMLSASVGFGVHRNGEILDHGNHIRRVTRAWLDHLALVQTAAYGGAKVLAVRATPKLDAFRNDPSWRGRTSATTPPSNGLAND
jgi:HK97 family phage prohead protease